MASDAYAGVRRRKQTPWKVKFGDALVSRLITIGGVGTIAAVLLVVLVLLATAWPLMSSPTISPWQSTPTPSVVAKLAGCDEYGLVVWVAEENGTITARLAETGELLQTYPSPASDSRQVTCLSVSIDRRSIAIGLSDGSFQIASIHFPATLLSPEQLPESLKLSAAEPLATQDNVIFQWIDQGAIRKLELAVPTWSDANQIADQPITAIDYLPPDNSNQFSQQTSSTLIATTSKEIVAAQIESRENMLTGAVTHELRAQRCPLEMRSQDAPKSIMLSARGGHVIIAWDTGTLDRYVFDATGLRLVESTSGLPAGGKFTCGAAVIARQTLLLGDDQGRLSGWNIVQTDRPGAASDGYRLTETHSIQLNRSPIAHISSSSASHLALACSGDSSLSLIMTTTDTVLCKIPLVEKTTQATSFIMPKNDGLFVVARDQLSRAKMDVAYPEATMRGLFGKVWYEGHAEPKYIWQSTAGTEQSEPKLSLMPLIFGTLKATLYAMIFSVPLAILAAIYTSEFLTPVMRSRVKPVIELMASLPSVILGFVAALVLAPILEENLCAVLLACFLIPSTFVFGAHLWNLLPLQRQIRYQSKRLWLLLACLPAALGASLMLGPIVEAWMYSGNMVQWLTGSLGSPVGGWMLLLIPLVAFLAAFLALGPLAQRNRLRAIAVSPRTFAVSGLIQLLLICLAIIAISWLISVALSFMGFDLRQTFFSGYQERNSLLVGAVMGFCVIPLIYTLADDALQSVPQSLRSASLGCGATPWQTTVRVVVPSAMSGMFSAIMIGFGRAVGETMVVLMAAGNTPIMEWNPFNGFRTLSATLATELPEAAKGSTHYRTLFLAALLLFTLTLVANTLAEFVRIRFRRKGSQL